MRELELERGRLQRQLDRLQRLRLETETDDETPVVWVSLFKGEQLLLAGGYHKPLGLVYRLPTRTKTTSTGSSTSQADRPGPSYSRCAA